MNRFNSATFNIVPRRDITAQEFNNIIEDVTNRLNERRTHLARVFNVKYMLFPAIYFGQDEAAGLVYQSTNLNIEFFSFPSGGRFHSGTAVQYSCYGNIPGEEVKLFTIEGTSIGKEAIEEYCADLVDETAHYQRASALVATWNNFQTSQKVVLRQGEEYKTSIRSRTYNICDRFSLWELYKVREVLLAADIRCSRLKSSDLIRLGG